MRAPSTEIIKLLEPLAAHSSNRWQVFSDWVEACYHLLRMLPVHAASVFAGNGLVEDDDENLEYFKRIRDLYGEEGRTAFAKACALMAQAERYDDTFGTVYEEWELTNDHTGQFFTPMALTRLMAQAHAEHLAELVRTRLLDALAKVRPEVGMARIMEFALSDETLETLLVASLQAGEVLDYEPVTTYDPACGSGRCLLSIAEMLPDWMVHRCCILFYGQDIDRDCVLMARANFMLYGMNGSATYLKQVGSETAKEVFEVPAGQQMSLLEFTDTLTGAV